MDQDIMVTEETEAGAEFVRRLDQSVPVSAAFWLKESEEGRWYLYIASDRINDQNLRWAYGEVMRVADQMGNPSLDPFRVKPVSTSAPFAQAALELLRRYPGQMPARLGGTYFGGMGVEGVYIYPDLVASPFP
jgi:hypothetical protein